MGTSLSKDALMIKIFPKIRPVFQRYEPNCGKILYLAVLKILKKSLDPNSEADDFQNLTSISCKIFVKIRAVLFK